MAMAKFSSKILLLTLAFSTIMAWSEQILAEDQAYGLTIQGEFIDVIDMHLHTGTWDALTEPYKERYSERVPKFLRFTMKYLLGSGLTSEGILKQMDKAKIRRAGVFAVYSPDTTGIASNEFLQQQINDHSDRLLGFASVRTDYWNIDSEEQLKKLETVLGNANMVGIKLAHAHQQMRFDDPRFDGVYEIAGRLGKPIYLHTGTSPNPYTRLEPPYVDPKYLEETIQRYPDTQFILGHSGYDSFKVALTYLDSCIELAQKYDNVYLEPGALGARKAEKVLIDYLRIIKENNLIDRVIYGSDGPQFPGYTNSHLERFVLTMQDSNYTTAEMRALLQTNFEQLFKL